MLDYHYARPGYKLKIDHFASLFKRFVYKKLGRDNGEKHWVYKRKKK